MSRVADAVFIVLAAMALVALGTTGALNGHTDPLASAAPGLIALGTAVLAVQVVLFACRLGIPVTADSGWVGCSWRCAKASAAPGCCARPAYSHRVVPGLLRRGGMVGSQEQPGDGSGVSGRGPHGGHGGAEERPEPGASRPSGRPARTVRHGGDRLRTPSTTLLAVDASRLPADRVVASRHLGTRTCERHARDRSPDRPGGAVARGAAASGGADDGHRPRRRCRPGGMGVQRPRRHGDRRPGKAATRATRPTAPISPGYARADVSWPGSASSRRRPPSPDVRHRRGEYRPSVVSAARRPTADAVRRPGARAAGGPAATGVSVASAQAHGLTMSATRRRSTRTPAQPGPSPRRWPRRRTIPGCSRP